MFKRIILLFTLIELFSIISYANSSNKFIAPQSWELKRLFKLYQLEKPEKFDRLIALKRKNYSQFVYVVKKLIYQQRLKDYYARLHQTHPKRKYLGQNKRNLLHLAKKYYKAPSHLHRKYYEQQLDSAVNKHLQLRSEYRKNRIEQLKEQVARIEHKWNTERQSYEALAIKRKALWQASRNL